MIQSNTIFHERYLLKKQLGIGGFASVWLAEDQMIDNKEVAIKIFAIEQGLDDDALEVFRREFLIVDDIHHMNLVTPKHFDVWNGRPYLILPYCSKGSLQRKLLREGTLEEEEIARIMLQMGKALKCIHEKGIIHQDIKGENILINDNDNYLLTDFGISTRLRSTLRKSVKTSKGLTVTYAAPERFTSSPQTTPKSDIFSLGVLLFELLTGDVPWNGEGGIVLLKGAEIPHLPDGINKGLKNLIYRCLNPDPDGRPLLDELIESARCFLQTGTWGAQKNESRKTQFIPKDDKTHKKKNSSTSNKKTLLVAVVVILALCAIVFSIMAVSDKGVFSNDVLLAENRSELHGDSIEIELIKSASDTAQGNTDRITESTSPLNTQIEREETTNNNKKQDKNQDEMMIPITPVNKGGSFDNLPGRNDFLEGVRNYEQSKMEKAYDYFSRAASQGYPEAHTFLGLMLSGSGYSVDKNEIKAKEHVKIAIEKGDLKGYYILGRITKNDDYYSKALKAIEKASENGDVIWQERLAKMYIDGLGVPKKVPEGLEMLTELAENGYSNAQSNLGYYFDQGENVVQDYQIAAYWFRKAAEQGLAMGQYNYAIKLRNGEGVDENTQAAIDWFKKAADQKMSEAYAGLAPIYYEGKGVTKNTTEGFKWYMKSALAGSNWAKYVVAKSYDTGTGTGQDWEEAAKWYHESMDDWYVSKRYYAEFKLFGIGGVIQQYDIALNLFKEAAEEGDKKSAMYVEVLEEALRLRGRAIEKENSYGDNISVSYSYRSPVVISKLGNGWSEEVTFKLKRASGLRVWPSHKALGNGNPRPEDELLYEQYTSSELFTKNGNKKVAVYRKSPMRTIGYMYVVAAFDTEEVVCKVPMALAWIPE